MIDDIESLKKCDGNQQLFNKLLNTFKEQSVDYQKQLKINSATSDYHAIDKILHRLSGGLSYICCPLLEKQIEQYYQQRNSPSEQNVIVQEIILSLGKISTNKEQLK